MAQVWRDVTGAYTNIYMDNKTGILRFKWHFVTFSGETQVEADVRYRKANVYSSISDRMNVPDTVWAGSIHVWNQGFAVGGNITAVDFPIGTFSEGVWFFDVNILPSGTTDWTGYSASHKIEITEYDHRATKYSSANVEAYDPHFDTEGTYGAKITVMNNAGAITTSAEQQFDVWDGALYLHHGGMVQSVPTSREQSDGTIKRVAKS